MLICTLISVFRPASAPEREGVGLGMGTRREGAGGARWGGGPARGLWPVPTKATKAGEQGWKPACSGGTSKCCGSAGSVHNLDRPQTLASGLLKVPGWPGAMTGVV